MKVRFVAQPYDDQRCLREFIEEIAADPETNSVTCVVAWAKRSGLSVVADELSVLRQRGETQLLVGISQGGATRQGLELALDLFSRVFVVHDEGITFHPKVYLSQSQARGRLFVGSNNLTAGGLQANYEAALELSLDLSEPVDAALRDDVQAYVDRLLADEEVTRELTQSFLGELAATSRYRIRDEDAAPTYREPDEADRQETEEQEPEGALFGHSHEPKRGFPPRSPSAPPGSVTGSTTPPAATPAPPPTTPPAATPAPPPTTPPAATPAPPPTTPAVERRWFKRLPRADAQHPASAGTHPTFALRLTQAGHPIDQTTYFRQNFFGGLPWAPDRRPRRAGGEAVHVQFEVLLPGQPPRTVELLVAHDPSREAGQGNFSTVVHWGELQEEVEGTDFTGMVVTLERLAGGQFRLTIAISETGPFLP